MGLHSHSKLVKSRQLQLQTRALTFPSPFLGGLSVDY